MTGCFDNSVGDAEGAQDSDSSSDSTAEPTNTPNSNNAQARTWFSSGGIDNQYWTDGQTAQSGQQRCVDYGPTYNSSTGEYVGEDCRETAYPEQASDWNTTTCTANGGTLVWDNLQYYNDGDNGTNYAYRYAPTCITIYRSISTSAGEALLIYEMSYGLKLRTTCNGVSSPADYSTSTSWSYSVSGEYNIVQGSAMNCVHEVYRSKSYANSDISAYDAIWSMVYAVQDTTVV